MSVLERLKSLFGGNKEDDNKKKSDEEVSDRDETKIKDDSISKQTSSNDANLNENGVSGIKSSESINSVNSKDEDKSSTSEVKASEEEVKPSTSKVEISEEKVEDHETSKEEVNSNNDTETLKEEDDSEEKIEEDVNESEDNSEDKNENDKERDNMTLLKDNDVYNMDDIDKEFNQKFIDAGIETVDHCFQCGTCGGTCPSGRRTPYKVREIVRKCLLGLREEVISDPALWMCTTCYTCQERCPRSVKIVEVIKLARNEAAHAGYMADAHKATGKFVIESGHGVPINDATKKLRKEIGLSEVPPTTHSDPKALKEIQDICKICEFDKLIGYEGL